MDFRLRKLGEYVHFEPQTVEDCEFERTLPEPGEASAYMNFIFAKQRHIIGMIEDEIVCEPEWVSK